MKFKPFYVFLSVILMVSGCTGTKINTAKKTGLGTDNSFAAALYQNYIDLSEAESLEGDHKDSDYFANRAINSAAGKTVLPENIDTRALPVESVVKIHKARKKLMAAFEGGARDGAPEVAAAAQANFDCWLQEQEENFQPDDIARCRDNLYAGLEALKGYMPAKPVAKAEATPRPPRKFVIYFEYDKAKLTEGGATMLSHVAQEAALNPAQKIAISGHADRAGSNVYNDALSQKRLKTTLVGLEDLGLDLSRIEDKMAFGETQPAIETDDNVPEPKNRRVEITLF